MSAHAYCIIAPPHVCNIPRIRAPMHMRVCAPARPSVCICLTCAKQAFIYALHASTSIYCATSVACVPTHTASLYHPACTPSPHPRFYAHASLCTCAPTCLHLFGGHHARIHLRATRQRFYAVHRQLIACSHSMFSQHVVIAWSHSMFS